MTDYKWLTDATAEVENSSFFRFEKCKDSELNNFEKTHFALPSDYRDFVRQNGSAFLFRDPRSNWHRLRVFAPPKHFEADEPRGQLFQIGYYVNTGYACYLACDGRINESGAVFRGDCFPLRKLADSFQEWLLKSFNRAKREYPKSDWGAMVASAPPFDERELNILRAIPKFKVRKIGATGNGNVLFEVENQSSMFLPYLSIGLRWGKLDGGAFLRTQDIRPGSKKVIEQACYKGAVDAEKLELFSLPLPTPEDRRYYREFSIET